MPRPVRSLIVALSFAVTACSHAGSDPSAFRWSATIPAGATVHFRDVSGSVSVATVPGQAALVTAATSWRRSRARDVEFVVTQSGTDYYICAMWRASGTCDATGYRARTGGGFLTMFSLFHRGSDVNANFAAQLPPNVSVDAKTVNGNVTIVGAGGGVIGRTVNGSVSASGVSGAAILTTTNGTIKLLSSSLRPSDSVHLSATNGVITAQLPADVQGTFDLRAVNGIVNSDFPLQPASNGRTLKHLNGQIGSSTRPIWVHTTNGVVTVTGKR